MTQTVWTELPILIDFDYTPADPLSGTSEEYRIKETFFGGKPVVLPECKEDEIISSLQQIRRELIKEARQQSDIDRAQTEYASGYRGKFREAI